ncbi:WYL domain-containing protein [Macrococcoides bohemicum]|uniref:WYL domain-containing protein n=1 Tax=Macrococcoides bohemicum TaxID=1903056 RepID=A0AAJ4PC41_9STAP|nr:WYL domain-containing protein [Macrococcus bohemicus]QYA42890.1 WYL domain-containing protein [Macrococcus bohemicus]
MITRTTKYIVEVEVIGDGILMWLFSQGRHVKVLSPQSIQGIYTTIIKY